MISKKDIYFKQVNDLDSQYQSRYLARLELTAFLCVATEARVPKDLIETELIQGLEKRLYDDLHDQLTELEYAVYSQVFPTGQGLQDIRERFNRLRNSLKIK